MSQTSRLGGIAPYVRAFIGSSRGRVTIGVLLAIGLWLALSALGVPAPWADVPIMVAVAVVGVPVAIAAVRSALRRDFGADLLGLLAMVTGAVLGEWLVAGIIALMLSGGEALEEAASVRASQVLDALAKRSPTIAHRRGADGELVDIEVGDIQVGDVLVLLPHEICPADADVLEGSGAMDESYLTGEPYVVPKTPGSTTMSGAVNGAEALVIRASKVAKDSRYAQIVGILAKAEHERPPIRRLADRLGGIYTLLALLLAGAGWAISGEPDRFLAVLVIATPCPLLIGVPVAVIGAISLAARNGIIVKDPSMLERISTARTMIFDKTGTLTYGRPTLVDVELAPGFRRGEVLALAGSAERYSRHPLASAIIEASRELPFAPVERMTEHPGRGMEAEVGGRAVRITGRSVLEQEGVELPEEAGGLECAVLVDGRFAALLRFRDEPRIGAKEFVGHLPDWHGVRRTLLLSGDRASEAEYLGGRVGLDEARGSVSPEEKLAIVRAETALAPTVFLGDGINDAPAMTAATVGVAFGQNNDVTAEAADAVVLDSSLERLDVLLHIGRRMRRIALQSAVGGIVLSGMGMAMAVAGLLPPIAGAIAQELIDVASILNASRVAVTRKPLTDYANAATTRPAPRSGQPRSAA